jgi:L-alanine-DL-glutamate epimerase-like enolase superfamily enzyme
MTDNKIAALAEAYHTSIAPHSIASFLGVTASFHAAEAVPNFLIQVFTRVEGAKGTYRITTPDLMLKPAGKDTAVKDKNGVINIDIPVAIGGVAVLKRV